jgi:glycerol uptake facilitator-like aquaporin
MTLSRRMAAECLGTAFLLAAVVGSGIMAEKLASGNMAIALLANTVATGATLTTLIFTFGPISGAHFNPAVTLADASQGGISWRDAPAYVAAQVLGAFTGVAVAHLMFGQTLLQVSLHIRAGGGQLFSEFVATFGLLCVIWALFSTSLRSGSGGGRPIHNGRILVHCIHFLRQSSGNTG